MRERRLTDKTRLTISIATLATLLLFIIASTFAATSWKSDIEHQVENNTEQIILINDIQKELVEQQKEQDGLFIEIKTDLKWIRAKLEDE